MNVIEIPDGARGFDVNTPLTAITAQAFVEAGFAFVARYVPRVAPHANDITPTEANLIVGAGLGLLLVQHVESESSWLPSSDKGMAYGAVAASHAQHVGLPPGATVVCDLEGVAMDTEHEVVIDYLKHWYAPVNAAGYLPALYVGWRCGLTPDELYRRTPFARYWGAYNLDVDQRPAVRGVCLQQHAAKPGDVPNGVGLEIDCDTAMPDALGGRMTMVTL